MYEWLVALAVAVPVVLGLAQIDLALRRRSAKRRVAELRNQFGAGKLSLPSYKVTIVSDDRSFRIISETKQKPLVTVEWSGVSKLIAYKRDMFAVDRVCIGVEAGARATVEVHEEMNGWFPFVEALPQRLPGCRSPAEWLRAVALPPFKTNECVIYTR